MDQVDAGSVTLGVCILSGALGFVNYICLLPQSASACHYYSSYVRSRRAQL